MFTILNEIDTSLFLSINQIHHPLLDTIMLTISYNKIIAISIIGLLLLYGVKTYKKYFLIIFPFIILTFAISDVVSYRVFKENVPQTCTYGTYGTAA